MNWFRRFGRMVKRGIDLALPDWDRLLDISAFGGPPTASGVSVSERSALGLAPVWACVGLISDAGAMLPGKVYERVPDGLNDREPRPNHYLWPIVHDMVNPEMPANEWRRLTLAHLLTWGNAYSWIEWDERPVVRNLWIIAPDKVKVDRESLLKPIQYSLRDQETGQWVPVPAANILHIRGLGFDGTMGYSPISMLREQFGLSKADQLSAAALHSSGMTSRLAFEYPEVFDADQEERFRKSLDDAYGGVSGKFKFLLLQNGMKATPISINPQDAQFLERSQYDDAKIYQIYRVPPHMVGDTTKATSWGTGVEQQTIAFGTYTLQPWLDMIETWLGMKLLGAKQRRSHFVEYEMKGLMRADTRARGIWYRTMIDTGTYSPNRILRAENEPAYPGGDVFRRPLNMGFVDSSGNPVSVTDSQDQQQEVNPDG